MAEAFIAEIRIVGFNFPPRGWATCDGQIISIAQNTALFALVGTTYGGDGRVTFGLPDLRGRAPLHQGQGPGLSPRTLGESSGSESVTLISSQMPAHNHGLVAANDVADSGSPSGALARAVGLQPYASTAPNAALSPQALGPAGGNLPHNNLQPYGVVNFVIALQGIFPSFN